ncbi:1-acyl-sn-glycerol-3-phosphate acyltransferase [Rhynchospora pubera]|uniref:1-acyl-sn-glycerol-3-phosphate acyltransferase n=1 Tax=Rhynchospora pubera TaxID=906938 RepID=A0AAV8GQZ8_9POAL|nr:1-acyl-sn-glycerol-3-phosphate acyltransferase [Rhynchospora pubera]
MLSLHCPWRTAFVPPLSQLKPRNQKREAFSPIHRRGGRSFSISRIRCGILPVDPWAPTIDSQSIASQLFAVSLFPYLGFLYFLTKSKTAPKLTLFGFYFLLAFVGATIPAGIYAKLHYGTSLSNVDWLHGSAESLLTLTNLFIVLGLREALRKLKVGSKKTTTDEIASEIKENSPSSYTLCFSQGY